MFRYKHVGGHTCSHADLHVHTHNWAHNPRCACKISIAPRKSTNTFHPLWIHTLTHTLLDTLMWTHTINAKSHPSSTPLAPPLFSITNSWGLHSLPLALPDVVFTCLVVCNTLPYVRQNYPTWVLFSVGVIALVHSKLYERCREIEREVRGK